MLNNSKRFKTFLREEIIASNEYSGSQKDFCSTLSSTGRKSIQILQEIRRNNILSMFIYC